MKINIKGHIKGTWLKAIIALVSVVILLAVVPVVYAFSSGGSITSDKETGVLSRSLGEMAGMYRKHAENGVYDYDLQLQESLVKRKR